MLSTSVFLFLWCLGVFAWFRSVYVQVKAAKSVQSDRQHRGQAASLQSPRNALTVPPGAAMPSYETSDMVAEVIKGGDQCWRGGSQDISVELKHSGHCSVGA